MKRFITSLFFFFAIGSIFAQQYCVSGTVNDGGDEPLVNAVLVFKTPTDSTYAVADVNGYFQHHLPAGSYHYAVLYIGKRYMPANNGFVVQKSDTSLGVISVAIESHDIENVVVSAQRRAATCSMASSRYLV